MQGENYQVDKDPLLNIPIPSATPAQKKPIIDLVDRILADKKSDISADTRALEHKIDELVYKLYGLMPEEIAIVEAKYLRQITIIEGK